MPPPTTNFNSNSNSNSNSLSPHQSSHPQLLRNNSDQSGRISIHSLHSLPSRSNEQHLLNSEIQHESDSSEDESDQEEDAGLISRLSDESDRKARRSKYNSNSSNKRVKRVGEIQGYASEDEEERIGTTSIDVLKANQNHTHYHHSYDGDADSNRDDEEEGPHSPRGFHDRIERTGMIFKKGVAGQMWEIGREAIPTLILSVFSLMFSGELLVHLAANIGELDIRRTRQTLIKGNMALLQVQALIVSSFAGLLAFVLGVIVPENEAPKSGNGSKGSDSKSQTIDVLLRSTVSMIRSRFSKRSNLSVTEKKNFNLQPRRIIHHHHEQTDPSLKLKNGYFEFVLVLATGMLSASLSSAILGTFMCSLVVVTRRLGGNPDNIASPLAASLGDLLTLTLLGLLGSVMIKFEGTFLATLILIFLIIACLSCFIITYKNAYVRELLSSGWIPLLVAMFISSGAGLVLDAFVAKFQGFALLAPVVTGLPGAVAAIFASRISTVLHGTEETKSGDESSNMMHNGRNLIRNQKSKFSIFGFLNRFGIGPLVEGWLVPITLLSIAVSINSIFLIIVWSSGQMSFGWPFAICFMLISTLAGSIALFLSHCICQFLWSRDYDPDVYCLPYVSSLVDVIGQCLLVLAFTMATLLGDEITAAVNAGDGNK